MMAQPAARRLGLIARGAGLVSPASPLGHRAGLAAPLLHSGVRACMSTGPASGGDIDDDMLAKLGTLSTQALIDGLWVMGWPTSHIEGARPLGAGMKCCGRAVTLRMVPHRPDIGADKPAGVASPEYEAFEVRDAVP